MCYTLWSVHGRSSLLIEPTDSMPDPNHYLDYNEQVVEEDHQAEVRRKDVDISRLEGQLAQCHIQQNDPEIPVRILLQ